VIVRFVDIVRVRCSCCCWYWQTCLNFPFIIFCSYNIQPHQWCNN